MLRPAHWFALSLILAAALALACAGTHGKGKVGKDGGQVGADTGGKPPFKKDLGGTQKDHKLVPYSDQLPPQDQFLAPDKPYSPAWPGPGGAGHGWRLPR